MSWLKSPWFWVLLVLGIVLVWLFFFRGSSRSAAVTNQAPQNATGASWVGNWLSAIEAQFSVGDSIMGGGGSG